MMVEVCTVWAPRPDHPQWRDDYLHMLRAQRHSVVRLNFHAHTVVSDAALSGFDVLRADLPAELMPAMIAGVVERLSRPVKSHLVFVDVDCLIDWPCLGIFRNADYHVGLTFRVNDAAPINNGAMFVPAEGASAALMFFRRALSMCGTHWGADQEAISEAAAPVPQEEGADFRNGAVVRFMSQKRCAAVPREYLARHSSPVVHFKGATKEWMLDYAREHHGFQLETA